MFCKYCGSELEKETNFCPNCGADLRSGTANESEPQAKNDERDNDGSKRAFVAPIIPSEPTKSTYSTKSKIVAGLLAIFIGSFGVHNFYLGYTAKAVAQLVLTLLSCCSFGITAIISGIWALVEGILILCGSIKKDGHGLDLID